VAGVGRAWTAAWRAAAVAVVAELETVGLAATGRGGQVSVWQDLGAATRARHGPDGEESVRRDEGCENGNVRRVVFAVALFGATAACSPDSDTNRAESSKVADPPASSSESERFANCPVTVPTDGVPAEVDFERPVPWVAEDAGWFGNLAVWVSLPPEGLLPSLRSDDGLLYTKFPWWRIRPGRLEVRSEEVGQRQSLVGEVPRGYGQLGFTPSGLVFTHSGCWRVIGQLGEIELGFVVWVCEADDYEIGAEERQACDAA
jgi:hypothetical protein